MEACMPSARNGPGTEQLLNKWTEHASSIVTKDKVLANIK